jgi:hypothetical protein
MSGNKLTLRHYQKVNELKERISETVASVLRAACREYDAFWVLVMLLGVHIWKTCDF